MSASNNAKSISKYLTNYAEAEIDALQDFPDLCYQHVLLIPAYRESPDFASRFVSQFRHKNVLMILVINQPEDDSESEPQQTLWQQVSTDSDTLWQSNHLQLQVMASSAIHILMVNRFSENLRIPKKQGVGLARKIAADIACELIHKNRVKDLQIYSTDADTCLPNDYFQNSRLPEGASAGVFNFTHISCDDADIDAATQLYEQRLHYYVNGLKYAVSPYAFHTVGSCLCFSMLAYCQVRGFPKKSGGEDFYLLNKLAKCGVVVDLRPTVNIRSRISTRVPFGTGPAVADIVEQKLNEATYKVYHPEIFIRLKLVLKALNGLCIDNNIDEFCRKLDLVSCAFFIDHGFVEQFLKWHTQYSEKQLRVAIHQWFDAFRTLKYVHYLKSKELHDVTLAKATEWLRQSRHSP